MIAIDSDGQKDARRAYIGTINRKAGEVAGKVAKVLRPQGGKTVVFVGTAAAANARERREGFFAARANCFANHPARTPSKFSRTAPTRARPRSTSRRPSASIPTRASSWASGLTTPRESPEEVAKFPELRKKLTVVTFDLDELAVDRCGQRGDRRDCLPEPLSRWATWASGC